jgi:hypothetical protein
MNVFDFAIRYNISRDKARRIKKDNPRWFTDSGDDDFLLMLQNWMRSGKQLTAKHLLKFCDNPDLIYALGNYSLKAEWQFDALGDAVKEAAPANIASGIGSAAQNDDYATAAIATWAKTVIPSEPVGHAWLAVRLLLGLPEHLREHETARIGRALINCRARPDFVGWWRTEKIKSRNVTIYQRPKQPFDL